MPWFSMSSFWRIRPLLKRVLKVLVTLIVLVALVNIITVFFTPDSHGLLEHSRDELPEPDQEKIFLPPESPTDLPIIVWWTPLVPSNREERMCTYGSCLITRSRTELTNLNTNVSAFMFYGTDMNYKDLPLPRKPHHLWTLLNEESPKNNWLLVTEKGLSLFNLTSTYSRHSSYPLILHYLHSIDRLVQPQLVPTAEKSRGDLGLVIYLQSDCNPPSDRDSYVRELMKYVKVDSYGRCVHNKDLPERLEDSLTFDHTDVYSIVAKYKFAIAFENALCEDYITEKFWRPLYAGTVPIVHGSPSIRDWAPDDHSIIVASDFSSPQDLASYLIELDNNDDEYNKYLEFKRTGVTNTRLLDEMKNREWTVDQDNGLNFIDGFVCYVCDELHKRRLTKSPPMIIANGKHSQCIKPEPILKHTGRTVEERIEQLTPEAREELEYWRGYASCVEDQADIIKGSINRGDNQEMLTEAVRKHCKIDCL